MVCPVDVCSIRSVEPSGGLDKAPVDVEAPGAPGPDAVPPAPSCAVNPDPKAAEADDGIPTCKAGATTPSTRAAVAGLKNANARKAVMRIVGMRMSFFAFRRLITFGPSILRIDDQLG